MLIIITWIFHSILLQSWNQSKTSLVYPQDYFACDAGCLDPPVKLSTETKTFPVKLTDPVTAVLYITSDQLHMQELKHAIHVKELAVGKYF